ncbi:MAG: hypothetical protein J2P50_00445 [Hyphomicrobiaceae bacterium]|nr:hypothetical protein [Hyphomicrobiaceae bacterium]
MEFCYWLEFEGDLKANRLEARFHLHGRHNRHCDAEERVENGVGSDTMAPPRDLKYGVSPGSGMTHTIPQPG